MKKIIFMVVAIMLTFGLFAQEKKVLDEKSSQEIKRLENALDSAGLKYEMKDFISETNGVEPDDAVSVDEFIEKIDSMSSRSSTYISGLMIIPIYELVYTGGGYVYVWTGEVTASPNIVGDDWNGVKHTRENSLGQVYETHSVFNPTNAYMYDSVTYSARVLCTELIFGQWVYMPPVGWLYVNVLSGDKVCGTASLNW